jgi:CDP-diacylglycerol--serine O-phosphatidyltransferase
VDTEPQQPTPSKPRRGIYLLPNLFTTAGLFAGFYAIVAAMSHRYEASAIAVFIAMVMDGIDGRVARLTHTQSDFGVEYDSLTDMVCFGLAPSLIVFEWSVGGSMDKSWVWQKMVWLSAFVYTAGAALRLARFNAQAAVSDKRFFVGLPSPSAAAVLVGLVWFCTDHGIEGDDMWLVGAVFAATMGFLMVSNARYYSFKEVDFRNRVPFFALLIVVMIFVVISTDPPSVLFFGFLVYVLSGPLFSIYRYRKLKRAQRQADS